jgi:hypothetical protein
MTESESRSTIMLELAEEFIARYRRGARSCPEEYTDRHPEFAAESHSGRRCARRGSERDATARKCRESSRNWPERSWTE